MSSVRQRLEHRLLDAFAGYYDIDRREDEPSLLALCSYHSRDSRYVLVKRAELWAAERHEYLYLFSSPQMDDGQVERIFRFVLEDGQPRITPNSQHMCTYLTALILCDEMDAQTPALLQKLKGRKNFKLSLHGCMEFRIAAVDLSNGAVVTNRCGRELGREIQRLVSPVLKNCSKGEEKPK